MELKHLRTFSIAAKQGSFTQAAAELGLTQAAVSQHIAALERELEVKLFDRSSRRVRLNPAGHKLVRYAERMLTLACEAREAVQGEIGEVRGTIRIAASSVPAEQWVPELLARFRQRYPAVRESLMVSDTVLACTAVLEGQADVGFVGDVPQSNRLRAEAVREDELEVVISSQHPLADRATITLEQLVAEQLLIREPGSGSRHCVERVFAEHGIQWSDLHVAMEVNSNDAIRAAVAEGVGLAFLSSQSIEGDLQANRFSTVKVRGVQFARQLYVIFRKDQPQTSPLKEFLQLALDGVEGK